MKKLLNVWWKVWVIIPIYDLRVRPWVEKPWFDGTLAQPQLLISLNIEQGMESKVKTSTNEIIQCLTTAENSIFLWGENLIKRTVFPFGIWLHVNIKQSRIWRIRLVVQDTWFSAMWHKFESCIRQHLLIFDTSFLTKCGGHSNPPLTPVTRAVQRQAFQACQTGSAPVPVSYGTPQLDLYWWGTSRHE